MAALLSSCPPEGVLQPVDGEDFSFLPTDLWVSASDVTTKEDAVKMQINRVAR